MKPPTKHGLTNELASLGVSICYTCSRAQEPKENPNIHVMNPQTSSSPSHLTVKVLLGFLGSVCGARPPQKRL